MKLDIGLLIIFTVVNVTICSFTSLWLNNNTERRIRYLNKEISELYDISTRQSKIMVTMSETDRMNTDSIMKLSGLKK